ncbi:MAG: phosphotransferase [Acidimicrobiaceae bacterium]|nr:phosphotransferase [Acidimicrobiaceae bacterium]
MAEATALPDGALPNGVAELVPAYLGRQRWFAGKPPSAVTIRASTELSSEPRLLWAVATADGADYQLLIGERPVGELAEFLTGQESAVLGTAGSRYYYDATVDPELSLRLLGVVTGRDEQPQVVRPVGAEQSNTSLIFDDRVIVKIYRRLIAGPNPDVEVTEALASTGFTHVPEPVGVWKLDPWQLAFAEQFLSGGAEGWALALTSLRDLYNSGFTDPGEAGGDFAAEVSRLGRMTAELHLALAATFGASHPPTEGPASFVALVESVEARLRSLGPDLVARSEGLLERLRAVRDPGMVVRVHSDYHLGQVMRTDSGWYVLDFEGEPARPREERLRPTSVFKDVAGMLRSLHYAARVALTEWTEEAAKLEPQARAWEQHNRDAFLRGYQSVHAVHELLPPLPEQDAVLTAYELDKALYEAAYEQAYRPDWKAIPLEAVTRLVSHGVRQ